MAYINGEFQHPDHEIKIEVLQPRKGESGYEEGMKIDVDWDMFVNLSIDEFKEVIKWMGEKAEYIENNFTKMGKKKTGNDKLKLTHQ